MKPSELYFELTTIRDDIVIAFEGRKCDASWFRPMLIPNTKREEGLKDAFERLSILIEKLEKEIENETK